MGLLHWRSGKVYLGYITDDFGNFERDCFAFCDYALDCSCTDDMAESGLCALNESLANVCYPKSSLMWRHNMVVYDRRQVNRHIILRHAGLLGHLNDLNLDVLDFTVRYNVKV